MASQFAKVDLKDAIEIKHSQGKISVRRSRNRVQRPLAATAATMSAIDRNNTFASSALGKNPRHRQSAAVSSSIAVNHQRACADQLRNTS